MDLKRTSFTCEASAPNKKRKIITVKKTPSNLVTYLYEKIGLCEEAVAARAKENFQHPTPEKIEMYTMEVTRAVREDDLDTLKELHASGAVLDCCSRFGESLVHIASRRSHTRIVKFLLEEAKVSVHHVDDLHRNPLHDACWTSTPNFEIVEMILKVAPEHAICRDKRGHMPFDYVREDNRGEWIEFFRSRLSLLLQKGELTNLSRQ